MKVWKRCLSLLLTLSMILTLMPISVQATEAEEGIFAVGDAEAQEDISGISDDTLVWTLTADGTLTISGTGEMTDYADNEAPWSDNALDICCLIVEEGVTSLGDYAFWDCQNLREVTLPDTLISIGDSAFAYCSSLNNVNIPGSVTSIGDLAFLECAGLERFLVDPTNSCYCSDEDGALYNKSKTELIQHPAGNARTSYCIPAGVTSIGGSAFACCSGLSIVSIPDGVTSIGADAFSGCLSLSSVNIPDSVTSIGDRAFCDCISLTNMSIPDSVTSVGEDAFSGCTNLTGVSISGSVTGIGAGAFYGCSSLSIVSIPDSVTSIGDFAFYECSSLTNIYYAGTEEEWNEISIGSDNTDLMNATIHYNAGLNFTVTFQDHDGTVLKTQTVPYLGEAEAPAPGGKAPDAQQHYCFKGWDQSFDQVTGDLLVTAQYTAVAHTEVTDAAIPATCTEAGKTAGKHCTVCKAVLVSQEEVPALGHTEVTDAAIPATCTEAGKTAGKHCTVCEAVLVAQEEIPATGHTEVTDAAIPATCTEAGKTAGKHCSVCEAVLVAQEEVPAVGHKLQHINRVEATFEADGMSEHWVCEGCEKLFADGEAKNQGNADALTLPKCNMQVTETIDGKTMKLKVCRDERLSNTAIFFASYKENGQMIGIHICTAQDLDKMILDDGIEIALPVGAWKVFLLDEFHRPVCDMSAIEIIREQRT